VIGDRTNCVFAINNEIFRLNNVHADRITIKGWNRRAVPRWAAGGVIAAAVVSSQSWRKTLVSVRLRFRMYPTMRLSRRPLNASSRV
jgi:hypothetical protein